MIFQRLFETKGEIILIATIALCTAINADNNTAVNNYLPDYITSLHYDAKIRLNYQRNDIIAECNITILINRRTENMTIPSVPFAIFEILFYDHDLKEEIYISRYSFNNELNVLIIDFTNINLYRYKFLPPGRYTVTMAYVRHIHNNKKVFKSLYFDEKLDNTLKKTGVDIMTAQQLFPCWHKPAFNATFNISIKHHKNLAVLSNMRTRTIENDEEYNMLWTHFVKSPFMLIQHLRVVITIFPNISTSINNVTLWGRSFVIEHLQFAECIAQQVLYFLKHQNIIDNLSKMDYVAVWDTQHNSIETQGLILVKESDIKHNEILDSVWHKTKVAYLITYQIISLGYKNVLLWSKPSFLALLATYIYHQIPRDFSIMNLYIVERQRESFLFSIPSNGNKIKLLNYSFEYIKSLNIWRMLHDLIPNNIFWTGIHTYIDKQLSNQTNATNADDLSNIMQTVLYMHPDSESVYIIKELISIWKAEKYFYPVLYVTRDHLFNITIFTYICSDYIDEEIKNLSTFVTYTTKSIMDFEEIFVNKSFWLSSQKSIKLYEKFDEDDWIIANLRQTGHYRVNYDSENWLKLAQYMNSRKYIDIHVLNRAQIIDDAFYFFTQHQIYYITFWKITEFLSRETKYVVWYPMFKAFEYITLLIPFNDANNIKENMQKILSGVLHKIGYDLKLRESELTNCLREEVVKWICLIGEKECREKAYMQMTIDLQYSDTLVIQSALWTQWKYCNGFASANSSIWKDLLKKWTETSEDKLFEYLTCCEDTKVISDFLDLTTSHHFFKKIPRINTRVNLFLLIVARHAGNNILCEAILRNINIHIPMYTTVNRQLHMRIAIVIIIITHQHVVDQLEMVLYYATIAFREKQVVDAVKKKIKDRKLQYGRQIRNYGLIGLADT